MRADVADLLQTPAEDAKREANGAAEPRLSFDLQRLTDASDTRADPAQRKRASKLFTFIRRAARAQEKGDHIGAAKQALQALNIDESSGIANHVMAMALHRIGHLSKALTFYERALEVTPNDSQIYLNLGHVAWKLDMLEGAEKLFRIFCQLSPTDPDGAINLAGVLRDQGRFGDGIEILRSHIYANPENHVLWNALGTVLLEQGEPSEALTFFNETLRLKPDMARGWHNLAYAHALLGDMPGSVEAYGKALPHVQDPEDEAEMRHSLAQSLLGMGEVEKGWAEYEVRLSQHYASGITYIINRPLWDGGSLEGKRFLLVGEQGLGDEVLFMNVVPDLLDALGPDGSLVIAPEIRLTELVSKSFPRAEMRHHGTVKREGRSFRTVLEFDDWDHVDVWAPMATAVRHLRPKVDAFPTRRGFLSPDTKKREEMQERIAALPSGPKVGIVWKSKLMTAKRAKYFSPFEQWKPVLQTPGVTFVNMQYGDVEKELAEARETLGVDIHDLEGVDHMNDLEAVASLGTELDLVIGPMNASTNLAMASGANAWIVAHQGHWPLLGSGRLPWYPQARVFTPPSYGAWDDVMADVASSLADFARKKEAA